MNEVFQTERDKKRNEMNYMPQVWGYFRLFELITVRLVDQRGICEDRILFGTVITTSYIQLCTLVANDCAVLRIKAIRVVITLWAEEI